MTSQKKLKANFQMIVLLLNELKSSMSIYKTKTRKNVLDMQERFVLS